MGTRTSSSARCSSKAERASVAEVLEGKAAAAFSKTSRDPDDKAPKEKRAKKDRWILENSNMFLADCW